MGMMFNGHVPSSRAKVRWPIPGSGAAAVRSPVDSKWAGKLHRFRLEMSIDFKVNETNKKNPTASNKTQVEF